jgi:quercetin dioxygenase-like cupin family protein
MSYRHRGGNVICSAVFVVLFGILSVQGQEKPLASARPKAEPIFTIDLAEVGLVGTNAVQRVTIPPESAVGEHKHAGRTSIIVIMQGTMTEVRGTAKSEYKAGDVIHVAEGITHHVENRDVTPLVYVEINTAAKT